ncbi:gametocyte-specific factor 1-like isoform X7 [Gopherus flavomarginatus]|uniref:gametocyte-specific factor 1-like isoform X7 n=1 Tax=Gopherus flavomarginatus TaxID=286002 RepID=UPI0021CC4B0A|nr:gametocyte-specific factor 1-like isoform X7 [Gopherus flavomarginatus]
MVPDGAGVRASPWSQSGEGAGVSHWLLRSRRSRLRIKATRWFGASLIISHKGGYFKEEIDTQRLTQRVLQQNLSQHSFSISKMELEDNYVDALDPEKLIQCPYDRYHQIRACRFPYHLIKCRKNHPDIAEQLATCPFNARHQVPRAEISHHISSCDDKSCIEQEIVSQSNTCHREMMNTVSMWQPPPCDEDWDKELQEQSNSVFVWGTFNSGINNSLGSSVMMEPKNKLMPGMRAPRSLPYSLSWKSKGVHPFLTV